MSKYICFLWVMILMGLTASLKAQSLAEAEAHFKLGDYQACQESLFPAFINMQKTTGRQTEAYQEAVSLLGDFMTQIGYYTLAERIALEDLNQCLHLYERKSHHTANAFLRLGDVYRYQTNYKEAQKYYDEAQRIWEQIKPGSLNGKLLVHQGELLSEQGYYTAAEALFRKASLQYDTSQVASHSFESIELRGAYAALYQALRNYTEALHLYQENLQLLQQYYAPSHPLRAETYCKLSNIYLEQNIFSQAQLYLDSAEQIKTYPTPKLTFLKEQLKAKFAAQRQEYHVADTLYSQLRQRTTNFSGVHNRLAMTSMMEEAKMYLNIGRYQEALTLYEELEDKQYKYLSPEHPDYLRLLKDMALAYWLAQKTNRAKWYFSKALDVQLEQFQVATSFMSEREKNLYIKEAQQFFEKYYTFLSQNAKNSKAAKVKLFESRMRTKGLLFASTIELKRQVEASQDSTIYHIYKQWQLGKEQLAKLYQFRQQSNQVPAELQNQLESYVNDLEKSLQLKIALSKTTDSKTSYRLGKLRKALKQGEGLLEMIRIEKFSPYTSKQKTEESVIYLAVLVSSNSSLPILIELPNGKDLESSHFSYYRNCTTFQLEDTESYDQFWSPIAKQLTEHGINKVYFSADGIYNKINLEGLMNPKTKNYVVDEVSIVLLTNLRDILKKSTSKTITTSSLLLGYPNYSQGNQGKNQNKIVEKGNSRGMIFSELPGTKKEVERIYQLLQEQNKDAKLLLFAEANEENLKEYALDYHVLHIATHGFFLPIEEEREQETISKSTTFTTKTYQNPLLRCGVILSGAARYYTPETLQEELKQFLEGKKIEDGILTAYEVTNMNLKDTELVVLSACETGLGEVRNGEGVYGFQRAFQTAGVKSIIMSLWKVDDITTSELLTNFYTEWLLKGQDKRSAFRLAQEQIKKKYPHPYYWAAFVMVGD